MKTLKQNKQIEKSLASNNINNKIKDEVIKQLKDVELETKNRNVVREKNYQNNLVEQEKRVLEDQLQLNRSVAIQKLRQIETDTQNRNLLREDQNNLLLRKQELDQIQLNRNNAIDKLRKVEKETENRNKVRLIRQTALEKQRELEKQRLLKLEIEKEQQKLQDFQDKERQRIIAIEKLRQVELLTKERNRLREEKLLEQKSLQRLKILDEASKKYYNKSYKDLSPSSRRYFGKDTDKVNQQLLDFGLEKL
jgi:hypothetical protein